MKKQASLEQIFGSRIRVRLLKLFLEHPDQTFYVREITRLTRSHIHSVRRELSNLSKIGLIQIHEENQAETHRASGLRRKFYEANPACVIFNELRILLNKGQLLLQEELARQLKGIGSIRYLALTGFFVDLPGFPTDLMIVGRVNKEKSAKVFREFEEEFGRTINYTILPLKEFTERKEMMDRFLYNFFENKKIVLIDTLPQPARMGI
ncbi:hypothetical protein A3B21_01755 [Candidatus Uhrbacteria bacterium RIFCSPLOWO2_01_FULL_47_24]|uniref:HTH arsR-type domain-containing protein n=1 Tax=Candidatus Uhrbacteria bacterium RIFCSPLOWO2_01_FULL_47_24 TaxID=1802401 RepID=A0A1F7UPA8_9BACT|nr:MAG: hypothetical protein A2753_04230 [Candidatus Uhrbacteria bacterium RIFCSPHIGHO2_01_FULL_47_11]OGL67893.1 MAG: hypothetical protein A3D58_04950 [Candidatus Uhrbacteria bacterium RIFCSPHIGHO2_02_FULL_46_47]OGL75334.1 MAG: hypothetical protein A3F52_03090 [Candidatus Uhrbacteria bacterium RIFCSPHIGHO2_12_FULL_47_11]OGL80079.1 MAG: hypothetical protein A3B21_01755 [Candidatus Uhrbacteria bacterium RIFCSPLOWO2_01_FULL_47_24]OGL84865.1 MAG: hypothetical protein A3J03_04140 [Candidatus Uhrbact